MMKSLCNLLRIDNIFDLWGLQDLPGPTIEYQISSSLSKVVSPGTFGSRRLPISRLPLSWVVCCRFLRDHLFVLSHHFISLFPVTSSGILAALALQILYLSKGSGWPYCVHLLVFGSKRYAYRSPFHCPRKILSWVCAITPKSWKVRRLCPY